MKGNNCFHTGYLALRMLKVRDIFLGQPKKFARLSAILALYPGCENCLRDDFHHPHRHASAETSLL
ncbi:MAG: hypothetical protein A2W61_05805 [Deltaproteobacteria bacterium RIFCSPLOWO2_01_44_7]|nr:MAG: hypothetical protein A2712_04270 [Deltaproteobacteria bacterium RIFCSPHIGHO2_01_FULL_43_49]OGQ27774.1 MAG: hypothetical protein A3D98_08750 [Deltaproteobacteria bacterium RIFCSPHIGHO2_12_FULL_44_21]OGQ41641.1 MAG: hypothetical protein A2W61_05805 [Deltaproteobacteria bacterium RIFCSPLOWO2_01_44_7]OGQ42019.1 MAG: hypothetical protein A3I70_09955 [Deltaproteobacteria bacterium RIFCSPLOWO2_02_FULL_44_34]OGQ71512.1 MAG: hypothetical protein A3F82_00685 [Deltaproteobacteria bacterium RIFCSPL